MPDISPEIRDALASYVTAPARLRAAVAGLDPGALNRRPPSSDWSIRDIVIHLADTEIMRASRIFAVIAQEQPLLPAFDEELYKRRLQYLWRDPELALSLFQQIRFAMGELLERCDADTWERTGVHEDHGPLSLATLIQRGAEHGDEHIAQVLSHRLAIGDP